MARSPERSVGFFERLIREIDFKTVRFGQDMPENAEKCGRSQARMAELTDLISKRLALACWTLFFVQLSKSISHLIHDRLNW